MKKLFSLHTPQANNGQIHAARDWFILVSVSIVILILSMLYNLRLVAQFTSGQTFRAQQKEAAIPDVTVNNIDNIFATRLEKQNAYLRTYHAVDPSRSYR